MKKNLVLGIAIIMLFSMVTLTSAQEKAKEWTFMVFLNADNNLDRFGVSDLNEMETVGSTDKVNIVVCMDREHGPANYFYVTKDNTSAIKSKIVKSMGEMDMGDYKEMVKFVKFCKDDYPAKKYCLVVWNHGSGWKLKKQEEIFKGLSYDDSSNNHMTTPQLGLGLKQINAVLGKKLDIFSNDACLMAMLEISAEIKDYCNYFVASEETEPGDGYGYHYILPSLAKTPTQSAETFAKKMVTGYASSYSSSSQSTTQSAVAQSKVSALIAKVGVLGNAMNATDDLAAIKTAHDAAQKFYYKDNVDIIHFATLLASKTKDAKVKSAAKAVVTAGEAAVTQNAVTGYKTKNSKGIAIYMPKYSMSSAYKKIALGKTDWVNGIAAVAKAFSSQKAEVADSVFNMEYPGIVAQAIKLEMQNNNFENFESLLKMGDTDALSILKKDIGTEILKGNHIELKGQFNRMFEVK